MSWYIKYNSVSKTKIRKKIVIIYTCHLNQILVYNNLLKIKKPERVNTPSGFKKIIYS